MNSPILYVLLLLLTSPTLIYAVEPQDIDAANQANNTAFTFEFRADSPKTVEIHVANSIGNTFWNFSAVNFPGCGPAAGEVYTCRGITIRLPVGSRSNPVDPALGATIVWAGTDPPPGPITFTLSIGDGTFSRTYVIKFGPSSGGPPTPPPPLTPPAPSVDPNQSTVVGGRIKNGRLLVLITPVTTQGKAVHGAARAFTVSATNVRLAGVADNQNGSYTLTLLGNFNGSGRIQCFGVPLFAGIFKTLDEGPFPR